MGTVSLRLQLEGIPHEKEDVGSRAYGLATMGRTDWQH